MKLVDGDLLEAEERYVGAFDRGRATSLHLFEHLYGDGRDRGAAMVDLKRLYERAGFTLATSELPDYLPVLLEYLSCRDLAGARDMLSDCVHILRRIADVLIARDSAYAAVLQALLSLPASSQSIRNRCRRDASSARISTATGSRNRPLRVCRSRAVTVKKAERRREDVVEASPRW